MVKEQLVVWVVPSSRDLPALQSTVNGFAASQQAPAFLPHATLFVAHVPEEAAQSSIDFLKTLGKTMKPFTLETQGVDHTDFIFKALFMQFGMTEELMHLYETVKGEFAKYAESEAGVYNLNPHMSLLYKEMPADTRQKLADGYRPPRTVEFDTLAYHLLKPSQDARDVASWDVRVIGHGK